MGYDLHITRAEHWSDDQPAISAEEWLALVAADPELELAGFNGPYFALWSGPSRREEPWFDWHRGRIHTKNPDPAMVEKAIRIAERFGARVLGDDGEVYLAGGQVEVHGVVDTSPAMDWRAWQVVVVPWSLFQEVAVGGLHSIGFVPGTEVLLIVSQSGRALHDTVRGIRLARDRDASFAWFQQDPPASAGLAPYEGVTVPVAGVNGGRLRDQTPDGWRLEVSGPTVFVVAPAGGRHEVAPRWKGEGVRAATFSDSGRCLAVAVGAHTVELYTRVP